MGSGIDLYQQRESIQNKIPLQDHFPNRWNSESGTSQRHGQLKKHFQNDTLDSERRCLPSRDPFRIQGENQFSLGKDLTAMASVLGTDRRGTDLGTFYSFPFFFFFQNQCIYFILFISLFLGGRGTSILDYTALLGPLSAGTHFERYFLIFT